jgi:hypothetical protein
MELTTRKDTGRTDISSCRTSLFREQILCPFNFVQLTFVSKPLWILRVALGSAVSRQSDKHRELLPIFPCEINAVAVFTATNLANLSPFQLARLIWKICNLDGMFARAMARRLRSTSTSTHHSVIYRAREQLTRVEAG